MNKYMLVLFVTYATLSGCSKDDNLSADINQKEVTLKYDEEFTFSIGNATNVQWSSSDAFVGIIERDGKFKARHIGETTITGRVGGTTVTAKVIVEPYITDIVEPYNVFGIGRQPIRTYETREIHTDDQIQLLYHGQGSRERYVQYLFDNGNLHQTMINFRDDVNNIVKDVVTFYSERYNYIGKQLDDVFVFRPKDGGIYLIGVTVHETLGLIAYYRPSSSSGDGSLSKESTIREMVKKSQSLEIRPNNINIIERE